MRWYRDLYLGEKVRHKKRGIIAKTRIGKSQPGIYMLTLPVNSENVLEIYPAFILNQKYYRKPKDRITVVGIAQGYDEAMDLMIDIITDCYSLTGQYKVRAMVEKEIS